MQKDAFKELSNAFGIQINVKLYFQLLLPGLEAPEDSTYKYRCLTHEKDWLVGQPIPDNILNSVQSSRYRILDSYQDIQI